MSRIKTKHEDAAREMLEKQHFNSMQHYLEYLKSDAGPISDTDSMAFEPEIRDAWAVAPTVYPPFED